MDRQTPVFRGSAHAPLKAGMESCTMSHALAAVVCRRQAILGDRMPATHLPHEQTILGSWKVKLGLLAPPPIGRNKSCIQNCC